MSDSEPVKLWRDLFKLNLSASWKADVDKTITDIDLWREILANWHYFKAGKKIRKSPGIKQLLTEYERLEQDKRDHQALVISTGSRERLSEWRDSSMPQVRSDPPSEYFRTSKVVR